MGKTSPIKVIKKKLIGLTKESLLELERIKKSSGQNQTQIVNDLLMGKNRLNSGVEAMISDYQSKHGVSRNDAMQALLVEAMRLKSGDNPL